MKELLAKFLSLSMLVKVVSIVIPLVIVGSAVATPVILNHKRVIRLKTKGINIVS